MDQLKLTIALIIAVLLQWSLRNIAEPFVYVDFPLIIVVYAALQRNSIRAIFFGTFAGIAVDALSGGLLGANGFTKTLIAYAVSELARRVYLDNLLLRIPVIAGACLVSEAAYFGIHRIFGIEMQVDPVVTISYTVLGTTITGTIIYILLDRLFTEKRPSRKPEMFKTRRQTRRRNPIRLGK
jgi:rod shape-determining protein MreD